MLFRSKHLLLAMNAADEARALSTLGWDGAVNAAPEGDALLVAESNVGYSKANRTVQSRLDYTVEVPSRVEAPSATLTVTYTNSNTAPARHCNITIIDYATADDSCYKSYVRVYVPTGTVPLGVDGSATPYEWLDRKSTRLNSSHSQQSRMPSSA